MHPSELTVAVSPGGQRSEAGLHVFGQHLVVGCAHGIDWAKLDGPTAQDMWTDLGIYEDKRVYGST
jgi:hypothetical protein